MQKPLLVITIVFILALLLAAQVLAVPKMVIPNDTFNFGFAPQSAKVSHVFWLKSVGDDTLKILDVKPG